MKKIIVILLVAGLALFLFFPQGKLTYGPGRIAPDAPEQKRLLNAEAKRVNGYQVQPLAQFNMEARALSTRKYYFGQESRLSPLDVVFGWGPMSDERVLEHISISQGNRWYHWRSSDLPIPKSSIQLHSANMHLIPSNERVKKKLKQIKIGHVVQLKGKLVRIGASDGWSWKSSLSRTDTGAGSCEIIWVETLKLLQPDQR
ncbi:MAG: hypothetical protein U5R06_18370 [candidate division KSB1 bacterium]|nr:hypothetical protein [candidate division KSB1 bacterium]